MVMGVGGGEREELNLRSTAASQPTPY